MSGRFVLAVYAAIIIEQLAILGGTTWLIGWCNWSPWWFVFAALLIDCAAPSKILPILGAWVRPCP